MATKRAAKARKPRTWTAWVWRYDSNALHGVVYEGQQDGVGSRRGVRVLPYVYEDRDACESDAHGAGRAVRVRVTEVAS